MILAGYERRVRGWRASLEGLDGAVNWHLSLAVIVRWTFGVWLDSCICNLYYGELLALSWSFNLCVMLMSERERERGSLKRFGLSPDGANAVEH